jgi:hypothetical protein
MYAVKKHRTDVSLYGRFQISCEPSFNARTNLTKFFISATFTGTGGLSGANCYTALLGYIPKENHPDNKRLSKYTELTR